MQSISPAEFAAELRGARIGIVGFPPPAATGLAELLKSVGALSRSLSGLELAGSPELDRCDALLVGVGEGQTPPVMGLVSVRQPWLLIGMEDRVRQNGILHLRADDILFEPFTGSELLFRLYRIMQRRIVVRPEPVEGRKSMVLIADDDPSLRAFLKLVLTSYGLDCHLASNGRDALAAARQLMPDLVLLDIEMPSMSGLEVLRILRQDAGTKCLKVLLLTASQDLTHVSTSAELRADGYISKPFNHLMLASRVKKLLAQDSRSTPAGENEGLDGPEQTDGGWRPPAKSAANPIPAQGARRRP